MRKRPDRPLNKEEFPNDITLELQDDTLDTPERAVAFCEKHGLIRGQGLDIEALINITKELELEFKDIGTYDAFIEKIDVNKYKIVINIKHSKTRQRFSMAHEYAHYQLHRKEIEDMPHGEKILHRSEERNNIEYQANQFASDILMPEKYFKAAAREENGDINRIAESFLLSPLAIRYRAKSLGMTGHGL